MTTATPRPARHRRRRGDADRPPTGRTRSSPRPWASLAAIVIAVLWTIPTLGLFISSFRPEEQVKTSGWWTFFSDPQVTLENYKAGADRQRHRARDVLRELDRDHHPQRGHPDHARRDGGLRLRLDEVPRPQHLVRRRLRDADRADPGDDDPAAVALRDSAVRAALARRLGRAGRRLLDDLALAHDLRAAAGDLPAAQLHARDPGRAGRGGPGRRRRPRADLHADHAAADDARRIAAFGIFQFLWVWNDLLVALVFGGGNLDVSRSPSGSPSSPAPGGRVAAALAPAPSSRSWCRWSSSSACSATSCAACSPAASRARSLR